ncbi:CLUMA_CG018596, isoform A [Clunio marinus]|uniref:CLUMA_CG018596, isoform A n=1 Tax=Clunio marinus TaxID=568069 RepID=A0A1J1IZP0_9DIPT|nr:CLUMA_CG018596, isoform A [Clunio marinus]
MDPFGILALQNALAGALYFYSMSLNCNIVSNVSTMKGFCKTLKAKFINPSLKQRAVVSAWKTCLVINAINLTSINKA